MKGISFVILALLVAFATSYRLKEQNKEPCPELEAVLKPYNVDLKASHIDCTPEIRERAAKLLAGEFRKREVEYQLARRDLNACCSPDCDWLLEYLELDATVVFCVPFVTPTEY